VTGGLAVLGVGWALRKRLHAAVLALASVGVPLLAFCLTNGGASALGSERYVLLMVPMYIVMIAVGSVVFASGVGRALSFLTEFVTSDVNGRASVSRVTFAGVALLIPVGMLAVLVAPGLTKAFEVDPKQIPVDLAAAYHYVLERAEPGDLILETSNTASMPAQWFDYYDSYFLRANVRPDGVRIARFGKDWQRTEPLCFTLKVPQTERACLPELNASQADVVGGLPDGSPTSQRQTAACGSW